MCVVPKCCYVGLNSECRSLTKCLEHTCLGGEITVPLNCDLWIVVFSSELFPLWSLGMGMGLRFDYMWC